jgi:tRNA pseudouridine55 synthase
VTLAPREVTIHALDLVEWDGSDAARPIAVLDVSCSAGTYVRALARDLGERVGSAAYLGALTRTASGGFILDDAVSLDAVRAAAADGPDGLRALLRPIDTGLEGFPVVTLDPTEVTAVARGQIVRPAAGLPTGGDHYRLVDGEGRLVAIGTADGGRLAPDKVFVAPPARAAEPVG